MLFNAFQSEYFQLKNMNIDDNYAYDDELNPDRTLLQESPTTLPIILNLPPKGSTQVRGIKILPP